ncbi:MAG: hypothetical protein ABEK04_00140 [Candidatus Nanohalobium sp.]
MEKEDWASMLTYGLATFVVLLIFLGSLPSKTEKTNISSVEVVESSTQEVFFGTNGSLKVVVSGNTSLPGKEAELTVRSANYSFEKNTLEVSLGSVGGNFSKPEDRRPVNYTIVANLTREVPETVLVHGVLRETQKFTAPRTTGK